MKYSRILSISAAGPLFLALLVIILSPETLSGQKSGTAKATALKKEQADPGASKKNPQTKVLGDHWYTVAVGEGVPYAYYNDRIEIKDGRLFYQNRFWKKEEGYINEEQLGGFSENTAELKPLFFNFHSMYRTTETNIDGTFKEDGTLTARIRRGEKELPVVTKAVPKGAILSIFFPIWLGKQLGTMEPGQSRSFLSVIEDNLELAFVTVTGRVRMEKPDEFAKKSKTRKLTVDYRDQRSIWYVEESGAPVRIVMNGQQALVSRVSKKEAESFLK